MLSLPQLVYLSTQKRKQSFFHVFLGLGGGRAWPQKAAGKRAFEKRLGQETFTAVKDYQGKINSPQVKFSV